MATSSIMSTFFMKPFPSTWNSTNKSSKACLQRLVNNISTTNHSIRFGVDRSLKLNSQDKDMIITSPVLVGSQGRLIKGGLLFEQNFCVRSFELDPEYKMTAMAIMNYLQETSLNYVKKVGLPVDERFGITPRMSKMDLVWVFRDMRIEVDRYPSWGDVVQILHWCCTSGRTGLRFDWTINNINTGETLVRASCLAVMMNKKTRKTCKLPEEVKDEMKAYLNVDVEPVIKVHKYSIPQSETMDYIKTGLTPGWNDLDVNYHVNNAKYLDWILESTPESIIYGHELWKINLEYRKECLKHDVIQSSSRVLVTNETDNLSIKGTNSRGIELEHSLCLESGPQVLRARTAWRPKSIRRKNCRGQ